MAAKKAKKVMKKPAAKKAVKVVAMKKPSRDTGSVKSAFTKSQMLAELSRVSLLSKRQVADVLDELSHLISRHVKKGGAGMFNMPGLFKIMAVNKPAVKARPGVNPFTGEQVMFKAKPARTVIKVRALKGLKDMV
jgi:nucleoid DNA-binding protein